MKEHNKKKLLQYAFFVLLLIGIGSHAASAAGWESFVIREGGGTPPDILPNNDYVTGATEFITTASGQKAAFGTSDIDGSTLGSITNLAISRLDDRSPPRFTVGSGPYVAPYINIWITDGLGNYAVQSAIYSDFQPIMGATLAIGLSFMVTTLIVDLLYGLLDPRVRYE